MIKLLSKFPSGFTPSPTQEGILMKLENAIDNGKKFIVICAPTGSGKSFIAKTLANHSSQPSKLFTSLVDNTMIYQADSDQIDADSIKHFGTATLTMTKNLQNQYLELFPDGSVFKGMNNYYCNKNNEYTCDYGLCTFSNEERNKCINSDSCDYYNARNECVKNKCSFYNYAVFDKLPPLVKRKEFIICDEASELEKELVTRYTFKIDLKKLQECLISVPSMPINFDKNEYYQWISKVSGMLDSLYLKTLNEIRKNLKTKDVSTKRGRKKKNVPIDEVDQDVVVKFSLPKRDEYKLKGVRILKEAFAQLLSKWEYSDYIKESVGDIVTFTPYRVDELAYEIFDNAKHVILMSATIVDHKNFTKTLGITDYEYIEEESTFPPEKAPIKTTSKYKINYSNKDVMMVGISKLVERICEEHCNEKGIIHTHTLELSDILRRRMGTNGRMLFRDSSNNNEDILTRHSETCLPTVLVSPSMSHGVDLKGDLARFQIIIKAPFLPLGSERNRRKMNDDRQWYTDNMLSTLVQMCGRGNRGPDDYCITYILDGNIVDAIRSNTDKLPVYFMKRFI